MAARTRVLFVFVSVCVFAGIVFASDFIATSLCNIVVGGQWSAKVSIRFQAKTTAPLAGLRLYWIIANPSDREGYASGNGGHYSYTLHVDSNGQPGTLLSTASKVQNELTEDRRGNFPLISFPPTDIVSGRYYDIVVENLDSDSRVNWASLDFLWDPVDHNQTPDVQIWVSDENGRFDLADGGEFIGSPVALFYSDGAVQGHGNIAVGSEYPGGLECGSAYGFPAALCQQ